MNGLGYEDLDADKLWRRWVRAADRERLEQQLGAEVAQRGHTTRYRVLLDVLRLRSEMKRGLNRRAESEDG